MTDLEIVKKVAKQTGLPEIEVAKIYKAYWKAVRITLENLHLKDNLTDEEFSKIRTSINIPSLGKIACTIKKYRATQERFRRIRELKKNANNKTNKDTATV